MLLECSWSKYLGYQFRIVKGLDKGADSKVISLSLLHCKKFVFSYTKRSVMFSFKRVLPSALHIFGCSVTQKRNAALNRNKYYSKFGVKCLNQC